MRYVFAGFEARTNRFELTRAGERIPLARKPLGLLLHLLSRAPELAPFEELFSVLWPDEQVTKNSILQAVRLARRALGDHGPGIIKTVRGRGYRIDVPVERYTETAGPERWATEDAFVGRSALLEQLESDVDAVLAGALRAILIAGEPGIGKTRTVEALCASERLQGAEVVWGRCLEGTGTPSLHPWLQILRKLVRSRSGDVVRDLLGRDLPVLAEVSEEIRSLRTVCTPTLPQSSDQQRFRLLEAVTEFLRAIGRERPLVVVIDDMHHADALSLSLWEHMARASGPTRVLMVGAYRHVAAPPNVALEHAMADTAASPNAGTMLTLEGLDETAVGQLLMAVGGGAAHSREVVSLVHARTGGNPLFVRGLAARIARHADLDEIPESVLSVIRERLVYLPAETRGVLEVAAVMGREFEVNLVAAVRGLTREACLVALDDAFQAGLVEGGSERLDWRFVHMVIGEAIYSGLPPGRRASLHCAVARTMSQRDGESSAHTAPIIAEHFRKGIAAAEPGEALASFVAAADASEQSFSFEEAAGHLEAALRAIDHLEKAESRRRFELLLRLARTHRSIGAHAERIDAGRRALRVARGLGAVDVARAAIAIYDVKQWGMEKEPEVERILGEALASLPDEPSPERAHLIALNAHVRVYPELEASREEARRAVEMAHKFGGDVLRETLYILHYVASGPDHLELREEIARQLAADFRGQAAESMGIAFVDTACDQLQRGDRGRADHWYRMALEAAGDPPLPGLDWYLGNYRAGLAQMRGDYEEGERVSLETFATGTRIGQGQAPASRAAHMMVLSDSKGDPGYAADLVDVVLSQRDMGVMEFAASAGADFSARAGRLERATEIVRLLSGDAFQAIPRDLGWTATMVQLARAVAEIEHPQWADQLEALIAPADALHGVVPGPILYRGSIAGARARLFEVLGRRDDAAEAYRRAIESERALGALPWAEDNERRLAALEGSRG